MANITRPELIKMVSEKIDRKYPQEEIYWILKGVFGCFEDILKNGDTLVVWDYFVMEPKLKNEQKYNNFGKGKVTVPPHYEASFRPYKKLRDACLELPVEKKQKKKKADKKADRKNLNKNDK